MKKEEDNKFLLVIFHCNLYLWKIIRYIEFDQIYHKNSTNKKRILPKRKLSDHSKIINTYLFIRERKHQRNNWKMIVWYKNNKNNKNNENKVEIKNQQETKPTIV